MDRHPAKMICATPTDEQPLLRTNQIAKRYGLTPEYLRRLRHMKEGPEYIQRGKIIVYDSTVFDEWFWRGCKVVKPSAAV